MVGSKKCLGVTVLGVAALAAGSGVGCVEPGDEGTLIQEATVTGWASCSGSGCTPGGASAAPQVVSGGYNSPTVSSVSSWKNNNGSTQTRGAGATLLQIDLLSYNQCQWDRDCPQPTGNYGYCVKYPGNISYCAVKLDNTCYDGPCAQGNPPAGAGVVTLGAGDTSSRSYTSTPSYTPSSTSSPVFAAITLMNSSSPPYSPLPPCANTALLDPSGGGLQQVNEDPTQCARDVSPMYVLEDGKWACDRWPGAYWDWWLQICWLPA